MERYGSGAKAHDKVSVGQDIQVVTAPSACHHHSHSGGTHEYRTHHQRHLALGSPRRERQHLDSHAQPGPAGGAERGVRARLHRLLPFPTIPHRTDMVTGKWVYPYRSWTPLPEDETIVGELLTEAGYVTMLVADTPHLMRDGHRFDRGLTGWKWNRGQEGDRAITDALEVKLPSAPEKIRGPERMRANHYRWRQRHWNTERDTFAARTFQDAADWIELNHAHDKFFLWVDCFDPHEPWDPPQHYVDLYDPGYSGELIDHPPYARCEEIGDRGGDPPCPRPLRRRGDAGGYLGGPTAGEDRLLLSRGHRGDLPLRPRIQHRRPRPLREEQPGWRRSARLVLLRRGEPRGVDDPATRCGRESRGGPALRVSGPVGGLDADAAGAGGAGAAGGREGHQPATGGAQRGDAGPPGGGDHPCAGTPQPSA